MGEIQRQLSEAFGNNDAFEILQLLQDKGNFDINGRSVIHGRQTFLMRLCHLHIDPCERSKILDQLLELSIDINATDNSGRTALSHACIAEKTDIIEALGLIEDCDPNISDEDGNTPLMYAVRCRKIPVLTSFLNYFSHKDLDVNHTNKKGACALNIAEEACDGEMIRLLMQTGLADPSVLEKVHFPRETKTLRTPVSPPLERICLSKSPLMQRRRGSKPLTPRDLSPLVMTPRPRFPEPTVKTCSSQTDTEIKGTDSPLASVTSSDPDNLLSDVQEEAETDVAIMSDVDNVYHGQKLHPRTRKSSFSLPDLRDSTGSLIASTPSSTHSYGGEDFLLKHGTMEDSFLLPQLSEKEEEEERTTIASSPLSTQRGEKGNSLSLPNLTAPLTHRPTCRDDTHKENYTYRKDCNGTISEEGHLKIKNLNANSLHCSSIANMNSFSDESLKLPRLNLNKHFTPNLPPILKEKRNGFSGLMNNNTAKGKLMTPRSLERLQKSDFQLAGSKVNMHKSVSK